MSDQETQQRFVANLRGEFEYWIGNYGQSVGFMWMMQQVSEFWRRIDGDKAHTVGPSYAATKALDLSPIQPQGMVSIDKLNEAIAIEWDRLQAAASLFTSHEQLVNARHAFTSNLLKAISGKTPPYPSSSEEGVTIPGSVATAWYAGMTRLNGEGFHLSDGDRPLYEALGSALYPSTPDKEGE